MNNMHSKLFIVPYLVICLSYLNAITAECNIPTKLYKDLHCIPIYDSASNTECPSEYDCSHLKIKDSTLNTSNKCYFDDAWYDVDDYIEVPQLCEANWCRCSTSRNFDCSSRRCPFMLLPDDDNCYLVYDLIDCCPKSYKCMSDWKSLRTCNVEGNVYLEGELFNSPIDRCKMCVCNDQFSMTTKYNPSMCMAKPCQVPVYRSRDVVDFCAPVYISKSDCCPVDFQCPNDNDISSLRGYAGHINEPRCQYGWSGLETTVQFGIQFTRTEDNYGAITVTVCSCRIPPYLTCYRSYY